MNTNRQSLIKELVLNYNMGLVSRKHLMSFMDLSESALTTTFWSRAKRDEDDAAANVWRRLFG